MAKPDADIVFEVSWEVVNKVGGIYTVVKSKAAIMKDSYKEYYLIGPYFPGKEYVDFEEKTPPEEIKNAIEKIKSEGIICHFGKWDIEGEPNTILVDFISLVDKKTEIKTGLWNDYKIDSYKSFWDFEEPVIWATAVGRLLEEISYNTKDKKIVGQFHEWLAGTALLHLKKRKAKIATVFTTHATMLGRTLAGNGVDLYGLLNKINPEEEAYKYNVQDKFLLERACAQNADVFSTVSEIVGIEAEKILGKKPDVLVLNGLDMDKFPTVEEFSVKHVTCRERLREFLGFHFFPYYTFDLKKTMLLFTCARYEYKNKGLDMFTKALAKLNEKLKAEKSDITVAAFFWIPQDAHGVKMELLENKNYYRHIKNYVSYYSDKILSNIVYYLVAQKELSKENIFTKEFLMEMKKDILQFKRKGNPQIVTHNINDEKSDLIVKNLIDIGLDNKEDDNVKVILNPIYLDGNDGLINLSYYDAMAGCHLGVFPSYYEPYGYTPLESAALGVPALTTDLAGFGRFIQAHLTNTMDDGIFVTRRYNVSDEEATNKIADTLHKFVIRDKYARAKNKLSAKELAGLADWKILVERYIESHNLALRHIQ